MTQKLLSTLSFCLLTTLPLSSFSKNEAEPEIRKKITACLAKVYAQQSVHKGKFDTYTSDLTRLINDKFCSGVNLAVLTATTEDFLVTGEVSNSLWSIDSEKQIQKIK